MSQINTIPPQKDTLFHDYRDREVDNDAFFKVMEEELPSLIPDATEIHKQARKEIWMLLAEMKKQTFIRGITEWTALEQKNFFENVRSEVINTGIIMSARIKEKIQTLIEDEIWREINDDGRKYNLQDGNGNVLISNMWEYQQFLDTSFLTTKETGIIPLDLGLTVNQTESIIDAKKKFERYQRKYNALVLVDDENRPIGIITYNTLQEHEEIGNKTLEKIRIIPDIFGYYTTSSDDVMKKMQEHEINIFPIIDSNTHILIGILTSQSLGKKELQYYSTTSLTKLSLEVELKRKIL